MHQVDYFTSKSESNDYHTVSGLRSSSGKAFLHMLIEAKIENSGFCRHTFNKSHHQVLCITDDWEYLRETLYHRLGEVPLDKLFTVDSEEERTSFFVYTYALQADKSYKVHNNYGVYVRHVRYQGDDYLFTFLGNAQDPQPFPSETSQDINNRVELLTTLEEYVEQRRLVTEHTEDVCNEIRRIYPAKLQEAVEEAGDTEESTLMKALANSVETLFKDYPLATLSENLPTLRQKIDMAKDDVSITEWGGRYIV